MYTVVEEGSEEATGSSVDYVKIDWQGQSFTHYFQGPTLIGLGPKVARAERELGITVHNFDDLDLFDGLDDVAALSAALDLSISVSTAVVAITAGVGTPTWVIAWQQSSWNNFLLAPRGPDVTRFERNTGETWDAVFAAMAERLRDLTG